MVWVTDAVYRFLALPLFWVTSRLIGIINVKMRDRLRAQQLWKPEASRVESSRSASGAALQPTATRPTASRLLFHAASMGEFEQLLPIIRRVRASNPAVTIIASFFSPSGFAHGSRTPEVDICTYLPFDTKRQVKEYLAAINPDVVIIDRYDVWRNFLVHVNDCRIPSLLVNATFPTAAKGILRPWFADTYKRISHISAVSDMQAQLLSALIDRPVDVLWDTRIDRVIEKCLAPDSSVERLRRTNLVTIVVGSTWEPDEKIALAALNKPGVRLILVPHEPTPETIARIQARITCRLLSELYSADTIDGTADAHILVDSVGQLLGLYAISDAAYVGGGFGVGVHSVTEPAVYGMPIATGPNIARSNDAVTLFNKDLLTVVENEADLSGWLQSRVLSLPERLALKEATQKVMRAQAGSSEVYANRIMQLLTSDDPPTQGHQFNDAHPTHRHQ